MFECEGRSSASPLRLRGTHPASSLPPRTCAAFSCRACDARCSAAPTPPHPYPTNGTGSLPSLPSHKPSSSVACSTPSVRVCACTVLRTRACALTIGHVAPGRAHRGGARTHAHPQPAQSRGRGSLRGLTRWRNNTPSCSSVQCLYKVGHDGRRRSSLRCFRHR